MFVTKRILLIVSVLLRVDQTLTGTKARDVTDINSESQYNKVESKTEIEYDGTHTKNVKDDYLYPLLNSKDKQNEEDEEEDDLDDYYGIKDITYNRELEGINNNSYSELKTMQKEDNLPLFLQEPENTYVVKNKPATLKCRVANALEIYFKCNGIKINVLNFEFVDPQSGVRVIEGELNVTRLDVEEYFGNDKYQCSCYAWTSKGHVNSQLATVDLAYLKKHFAVTPQSQLVKLSNSVTFRCEPPPAAPFPQVFWLKNGAPVLLDNNIQLTKEDHLFLKQVTLLDSANYTCVAENLAGKRLSEPAVLTVFENGGWTTWSPWGDCYCPDQYTSSQKSPSGRRRVRSCTDPRPLNGGQPCVGPSVQKTEDCLDCDLDIYVDILDELADDSTTLLKGRWSPWSEWSECDSDCLKLRRRRCLTSDVCIGEDHQMEQCPFCVRTSGPLFIPNGSPYWPLLISLSFAFLIFTVLMMLGIKYIKMKNRPPVVKLTSGTHYKGSVIKRTLVNQPDLTLHEEFNTMSSKCTSNHKHRSVSTYPQHEHLYEDPQLAYGFMPPADYEMRSERSNRSYTTRKEFDFKNCAFR